MSATNDLNQNNGILEVAILQIRSGMTAAFEANFNKAKSIIISMSGYQSHSLQRGIENDHKYILLVKWDTIEDHEEGFRKSFQYQKWKALLHHFYDPFPTVDHFTCLI
jgi:heme-degrading monooxygenase HmoA